MIDKLIEQKRREITSLLTLIREAKHSLATYEPRLKVALKELDELETHDTGPDIEP